MSYGSLFDGDAGPPDVELTAADTMSICIPPAQPGSRRDASPVTATTAAVAPRR